MALSNLKRDHLMPLHFKGLKRSVAIFNVQTDTQTYRQSVNASVLFDCLDLQRLSKQSYRVKVKVTGAKRPNE